jgi:hypothetical protein
MANPLEKHFLLVHNNMNVEVNKKLMNFIEKELVPEKNVDKNRHLYWMRIWGGKFYLMGTFENTIWTPSKIIDHIRKGVPDVHSLFCVEVQGMECQGLMEPDFWDFVNSIQDLTKHISDKKRFNKLKRIKDLLEKKEELKRKEAELLNRESELMKKKEILSEEEELFKKELEIKKRKKIFGIF